MKKLFGMSWNQNESNTISIDKQIYTDVYSAQQLLLDAANLVLSKPSEYNEERYNRLKQMGELGFSNASEVKEFNAIDTERKKHDALKAKIEYYNFTYPQYKFINQDAVKQICNKYKLYLTTSSDYIAEIPEKNQNEIINFKVKRKDTRMPDELYDAMVMALMRIPLYPAYQYDDAQNEFIAGKNLLIIAPEHKLEMRHKEKHGHILKIKDPIVLQPVADGYLIVSSWGLEASDELAVNSKNN